MPVILGLNAYHPGASAALLIDGVPIAAVAEERLNRIKYYGGFPSRAVSLCLEMAGLGLADVDVVAVGRDSSANLGRKIEYTLRHPAKLLNLIQIRAHGGRLDDLKTTVADECGVAHERLRFTVEHVEHHLAHTASAYFGSPWERSAGITIDGSGDFVTCLMSECVGPDIKPLRRIYVPHSLGSLYTAVCQFIGFTGYGDEGKVMGLAPLGTDRYTDFFREMVCLTSTGLELDDRYFLPFGANQGIRLDERGELVIDRLYSDLFVRRFGEPRVPHAEITERDRDLAFCLQKRFEEAYMHLLKMLHGLVPVDRVALAGGCALNSVANGALLLDTPFRHTEIHPAAGDEGLALGAALYVSNSVLREGKRWQMQGASLGPEFAAETIALALSRAGYTPEPLERDELLRQTAAEIAGGKVVGWFQGRMEWGPRALGNRSILAHPGLATMKDTLNARIKHREWFRPFAPSVLEERQSEIFEQSHPSPFMLHVSRIRPEWRERLCAVNHVDDTGRLQTVSRKDNPLYYDLIVACERLTGLPVVLNTSFNENEPIVCTPDEAIDCFRRTRMDALAIGPYLCRKPSPD
ncbi:MAG: carbamoyltransferase C-terminal domain-containing protein [Thermoanaerobaculia bacterium]